MRREEDAMLQPTQPALALLWCNILIFLWKHLFCVSPVSTIQWTFAIAPSTYYNHAIISFRVRNIWEGAFNYNIIIIILIYNNNIIYNYQVRFCGSLLPPSLQRLLSFIFCHSLSHQTMGLHVGYSLPLLPSYISLTPPLIYSRMGAMEGYTCRPMHQPYLRPHYFH